MKSAQILPDTLQLRLSVKRNIDGSRTEKYAIDGAHGERTPLYMYRLPESQQVYLERRVLSLLIGWRFNVPMAQIYEHGKQGKILTDTVV